PFGQPGNVVVSSDPRTVITYNPLNNTVTLDLTNLDQNELPTDRYALVVQAGDNSGLAVTDLAGNSLDGEFGGSFPSGNGTAGGNFFQDLGSLTLLPPTITSVVLDPNTLRDASGNVIDPSNDSGIVGDENTNNRSPFFVGQVSSSFPGALAGLTVLAEF